jgi:hypothetical protein
MHYAQRTVDATLVRLWLVESVRIDDVVTPLEGRRRLEIPLALYRACVREPSGFARAVKGVILHSISRRSKNGASHRTNFDTPPLIGNCPDTLVSRQIPMKTHDLEMNRYLEGYRPRQLMEVPVWLTLT